MIDIISEMLMTIPMTIPTLDQRAGQSTTVLGDRRGLITDRRIFQSTVGKRVNTCSHRPPSYILAIPPKETTSSVRLMVATDVCSKVDQQALDRVVVKRQRQSTNIVAATLPVRGFTMYPDDCPRRFGNIISNHAASLGSFSVLTTGDSWHFARPMIVSGIRTQYTLSEYLQRQLLHEPTSASAHEWRHGCLDLRLIRIRGHRIHGRTLPRGTTVTSDA